MYKILLFIVAAISSLVSFAQTWSDQSGLKITESLTETGEFADGTAFYTISNKNGGNISVNSLDGNYVSLASTVTGDEALWAIVGSNTAGFKFVNKATKQSIKSANAPDVDPKIAINPNASTFVSYEEGTAFDISTSKVYDETVEHFVVRIHGTAKQYWNKQEGKLGIWNATAAYNGWATAGYGDDGSKFRFNLAEVKGATSTITWKIVDTDGKTKKTYTEDYCIEGKTYTINLKNPYLHLTGSTSVVATKQDQTIELHYDLDLPFQVTSDAANPKWYKLCVQSDQQYYTYIDDSGKMKYGVAPENFSSAYYWYITGDAFDGFQLWNHNSIEPIKAAVGAASVKGEADPTWQLHEGTSGSKLQTGIFSLYQEAKQYLNCQNNEMRYWNQHDKGSTFAFEDIDLVQTTITWNIVDEHNNVKATYTKSGCIQGFNYSAEFSYPFLTLTGDRSVTATESNQTITLTYTVELPFTVTTDTNNPVFGKLRAHSNMNRYAYLEEDGTVKHSAAPALVTASYLWYITGDVFTGFQLWNKTSNLPLKASEEIASVNGEAASVWQLRTGVAGTAFSEKIFSFWQEGKNYLNCRANEGDFRYWTKNDAGSTLLFEEYKLGTSTITWNIVDENGNVKDSYVRENCNETEEYTIEYSKPFIKLKGDNLTVVATAVDQIIEVTYEQDLPFPVTTDLSQPILGKFHAHSNFDFLAYLSDEGEVKHSQTLDLLTSSYIWYITGDVFEGFQLWNKNSDQPVKASSEIASVNGDANSVWKLHTGTPGKKYTDNIFAFWQEGVMYLNCNAETGDFRYWGTNDYGSSFYFEEVEFEDTEEPELQGHMTIRHVESKLYLSLEGDGNDSNNNPAPVVLSSTASHLTFQTTDGGYLIRDAYGHWLGNGSKNWTMGITESTVWTIEQADENYVRIKGDKGYLGTDDNNEFTPIWRNKKATDPRTLWEIVPDNTTGVELIANTTKKNEGAYNLFGQCLNTPTKGIFIVGGKKIIR